MTKVWTAARGWVYLHVAADCCTREVAYRSVNLRIFAQEAIACVEAGLLARAVPAGRLTLGSDSGRPFTARDFRKHLSACGVTHRRGSYRDPESQAFMESWFGQFKKRCAWRAEWETIEQTRAEIGQYIECYHYRPHSGVGYRTPTEVTATWRPDPEPGNLQSAATSTDNHCRVHVRLQPTDDRVSELGGYLGRCPVRDAWSAR